MNRLEEARNLGRDAGKAAGSWAADGNTPAEHCRRVLAMLDDGDPAADDFLPRRPNLSGEFADDPTPRSVFEEVTGREPGAADADALDEIAQAWEEGADDTYMETCEATLRGFLPD